MLTLFHISESRLNFLKIIQGYTLPSARAILFVTPTSGGATYIVTTVSCFSFFFFFFFFSFLRGHNFFSTEPIGLKFGTYLLNLDTSGRFFFLGDPTSESWVTVSQVEISQNRSKILMSGPIRIKIGCELADL